MKISKKYLIKLISEAINNREETFILKRHGMADYVFQAKNLSDAEKKLKN